MRTLDVSLFPLLVGELDVGADEGCDRVGTPPLDDEGRLNELVEEVSSELDVDSDVPLVGRLKLEREDIERVGTGSVRVRVVPGRGTVTVVASPVREAVDGVEAGDGSDVSVKVNVVQGREIVAVPASNSVLDIV